jgi:RNA ligase
MNYRFPRINRLSDVRQHIEGHEEFIVAERGDHTIVNYTFVKSDTFDMDGSEDIGGAMRRECRGLIFASDGTIMSRPFHKFFNVGERAETQPCCIDIAQPHVITEKLDGSMIRPIRTGGTLRLATKMGVTEVAEKAEPLLTTEMRNWLQGMMDKSLTPILEYIAPDNRIVLEYAQPQLILLAVRCNVTGEYLEMPEDSPFPKVPQYGSLATSLGEYIAMARQQQNREGDVLRFADGHMVKIKNDWYVNLHRIIGSISSARNIVALILTQSLDDIMPKLPASTAAGIRIFEAQFWKCLEESVEKYNGYYESVKSLTRKEYAQQHMPLVVKSDPFAPVYVFNRMDGRDGRQVVMQQVEKSITSNTKWDACAQWMGIPPLSLQASPEEKE